MLEASALFLRAADSDGMGGVDVSASGPSPAAVSGLVQARVLFEAGCLKTNKPEFGAVPSARDADFSSPLKWRVRACANTPRQTKRPAASPWPQKPGRTRASLPAAPIRRP